MIRLKELLVESQSKEQLALEFLSKVIKDSPFAGKVFLAGGAIRDEVMGKPVKDIDIVVTEPDGGIKFAEWITKKLGAYKQDANPVTFPRFGTAKFNLRGIKIGDIDLSDIDIESVMTRGEMYTPGSRKPAVEFTDLAKDAERRDFTVNDLYKDLTTGRILDPTGKGFSDIKHGIIRTPVDSNITFKDDPLRMLRAVRFVCRYNWKMSRNVLRGLINNAPMLQKISKERIQDEFNKMVMGDNPDVALRILSRTGLLKQFVPEFDLLRGVRQNMYHKDDAFDHTLEVVKYTPKDLKARLAAVFHDIGKPQTFSQDPDGHIHFYDHEDVGAQMTEDIMRRLSYSNDIIQSVRNIVQNHMRLKAGGPEGDRIGDKGLRKFSAALGDDLDSAWGMMHGDNLSHSEGHRMPNQITNFKDRVGRLAQMAPQKPKLPINGHDIMQAFNLQPGPPIKHILKAIEDAWFENPMISREDAFGVAKKAYDEMHGDANTNPEDVLNQRITNVQTGNSILVRTALQYDPNHPARQAAERLLRKSNEV